MEHDVESVAQTDGGVQHPTITSTNWTEASLIPFTPPSSCRSNGYTATLIPFIYGSMVVFLDLDEDDVADDPHAAAGLVASLRQPQWRSKSSAVTEHGKPIARIEERPNPNINSVSAALACYP